MQRELNLKPPMHSVDRRVMEAQPSLTAALRLCQPLCGLEDQEIGGKHGSVADVAPWSRLTRSARHDFAPDQLNALMDLRGNAAPLTGIARSRGYELVPLDTDMQRRLRVEREKSIELERENTLLRTLLTGKRQ